MSEFQINTNSLNLDDIEELLASGMKLALSEESKALIQRCRDYLDHAIEASEEPLYGITTGFGSLYNQSISKDELSTLQENIIMSHACGAGDEIPKEIVRIVLLLKIKSLSFGHSAVQIATVERLIEMYNENALPVLYQFGSLGASGDLAPLAHLSLPLLGLGELNYQGKRITGAEYLKIVGHEPLALMSKEGLALLNGTQVMSAYSVSNLLKARKLLKLANLLGASSVDAFDGRLEPFHPMVQKVRRQNGQIHVANEVRDFLKGSELIKQHKKHIQDPYAFRCIPQVHGATYDTLRYISDVLLAEINGVTDNPLVFPDEEMIISAGNFHGQPLALVNDYLSIAIAEIGNISERRTYQLISGQRELPDYLVTKPGLNSGLMIPQYTAASIVSKNKVLCHPASVDSITSSNGQEDHVSMGMTAAYKANEVVDNVYIVLGIELLTVAQALDLRKPLQSSPQIIEFMNNFREIVSFIEHDRVLHDDIEAATSFLKDYQFE